MKTRVAALTSLIATIGLTVPVAAQIRNPAQDFFDQGREQLEREIQVLQAEPFMLQENLEKPASQPLLDVSPALTNPPSEQPQQVEPPTEQPNESEN